jgi:putative solute:sodium symporter small subunit
MATPENRLAHWRANLRLITCLLCIWAFVSFGCSIFFVDQLDKFKIGGFKLGFWMAQQGSIYVFVVLIAFYAWRMNRIDREHNVHEE